MNIELACWVLGDKDCSVDVLNDLIDETCLSDWKNVNQIDEKIWVEDVNGKYWGALVIWNDDKPPLMSLPKNAPKEILGRDPDIRFFFNIVSKT
ncbi:hypothetical protein V4D09_02595 [Vibrio mimicus]|uniref:hypothetical protein n=1 Tax=Vibrio mimicus TaxID=674 RepID=UPI002F9431A6